MKNQIKELQQQNEALSAENLELKNKLSQMKAALTRKENGFSFCKPSPQPEKSTGSFKKELKQQDWLMLVNPDFLDIISGGDTESLARFFRDHYAK